MFPAKEILEAIQNEAEFDNTEVEKSIINALEILNKDLIYCQYEHSSEIEDAIVAMNKAVAAANSDIEEEDDDDDEEEDLIDLEDDDEEDEEPDELIIEESEEPQDAEPDPIKE